MESPCIKTCIIDPADGLCRGCRRSRHEIARWSSYSDAERRRIMQELKSRGMPAGKTGALPDPTH